MPILQFDTEVAENNCRQIRLALDHVQDQINQLNSTLATLDYAWSGSSSLLFIQELHYHIERLRQLRDELQILAHRLDKHTNEWEELDRRNATIWRMIA